MEAEPKRGSRRLTRSAKNRVIAGVCGGLGEYLGIDPGLVRVFFVLLGIGRGFGVLIYILLWLLIPREDMETAVATEATVRAGADEMAERARTAGSELREAWERDSHPLILAIGVGLIILGVLALLEALHIAWLWWLSLDTLWPVLLIVAGLVIILRRR